MRSVRARLGFALVVAGISLVGCGSEEPLPMSKEKPVLTEPLFPVVVVRADGIETGFRYTVEGTQTLTMESFRQSSALESEEFSTSRTLTEKPVKAKVRQGLSLDITKVLKFDMSRDFEETIGQTRDLEIVETRLATENHKAEAIRWARSNTELKARLDPNAGFFRATLEVINYSAHPIELTNIEVQFERSSGVPGVDPQPIVVSRLADRVAYAAPAPNQEQPTVGQDFQPRTIRVAAAGDTPGKKREPVVIEGQPTSEILELMGEGAVLGLKVNSFVLRQEDKEFDLLELQEHARLASTHGIQLRVLAAGVDRIFFARRKDGDLGLPDALRAMFDDEIALTATASALRVQELFGLRSEFKEVQRGDLTECTLDEGAWHLERVGTPSRTGGISPEHGEYLATYVTKRDLLAWLSKTETQCAEIQDWREGQSTVVDCSSPKANPPPTGYEIRESAPQNLSHLWCFESGPGSNLRRGDSLTVSLEASGLDVWSEEVASHAGKRSFEEVFPKGKGSYPFRSREDARAYFGRVTSTREHLEWSKAKEWRILTKPVALDHVSVTRDLQFRLETDGLFRSVKELGLQGARVQSRAGSRVRISVPIHAGTMKAEGGSLCIEASTPWRTIKTGRTIAPPPRPKQKSAYPGPFGPPPDPWYISQVWQEQEPAGDRFVTLPRRYRIRIDHTVLPEAAECAPTGPNQM